MIELFRFRTAKYIYNVLVSGSQIIETNKQAVGDNSINVYKENSLLKGKIKMTSNYLCLFDSVKNQNYRSMMKKYEIICKLLLFLKKYETLKDEQHL